MGTAFSSLFPTRKRSRETHQSEADDSNNSGDDVADLPPSRFSSHLRRLRYRCTSGARAGTLVCRHVADDAATQQTYGCHAHLYETATAGESHGVVLAWCVEETVPISTLSLLSLCRVANSCRKKTLLAPPQGDALLLTYTATL